MAILTLILYSLSIMQFADSLWMEGDYYNAITEFKRAVYLNEETERALWKIGLGYEKMKKYRFAAKYFGELAFTLDTLPVKHHLAYNLIEMGRYHEAKLVVGHEDDSLSLIIEAVCEGLSGNFERADSMLGVLNIKTPSLPVDEILRYPSYIAPGFGFFLLGDYKRGTLSLFFTSATGYLTYYFLKKKRYLEAAIVFNTLFLRFYTGNIHNALYTKKRRKKEFYRTLLREYFLQR